ncbi:MAG: CPBP family intramembrane metalloprotease [Gemmataceae bacterium]|nr:CPBP family intramembrane metalloprotease [Gemmataceae bacterium]
MSRDWFALAFAMVYPSFMSWVYFFALASDGGAANDLALVAYRAGKAVQFSFPLVYTWLFDREQLRPRAPTTNGLLLGVGFGLVVVALMFMLYHVWLRGTGLMDVAGREIVGKLREFQIATPSGFVLFGVFISVAHSLFEEYYFRWFIFGRLRKHIRLWPAVMLSAVAFMAHHVLVMAVYFPGPFNFALVVMPFALCVAVGGAAWAWLYERSESLLAPWLSHLVVDVGIMVIGYDLVAPYLSPLAA